MPAYRSTCVKAAFSFSVLLAFLLSTRPTCAQEQSTPSAQSTIPVGTVLPVILRSTVSPDTKPGTVIHGEIAQHVPLPDGSKINPGTRVEGRVVEATAGSDGAKLSIRFDKIYYQGSAIPITTAVRAMAGFMTVLEARQPTSGVGEGDVYQWADTTQIGGQTVFGTQGKVGNENGQIVGRSTISGNALDEVMPSGRCRGPIANNNAPQALWVFSSDACGVYGISKVRVDHAGRTDPIGTVTLSIEGKGKLRDGDGLLLRVLA